MITQVLLLTDQDTLLTNLNLEFIYWTPAVIVRSTENFRLPLILEYRDYGITHPPLLSDQHGTSVYYFNSRI
jgi:hypothetical protein